MKENKSVSRYQLVFIKRMTGQKTTIEFRDINDNGKIRNTFTLTQIDDFTTKCANEEELKSALDIKDDGYLTIEYQSDYSTKRTDLAFEDMKDVEMVARNNYGKSKVSDFIIENPKDPFSTTVKGFSKIGYANELIDQLNSDSKLYDYLKNNSNRYSIKRLMNSIDNYRIVTNEKDGGEVICQAVDSISRELTQYKTLRGVMIAINHYRKLEKGQNIPVDRNTSIKEEMKAKENYDKYLKQQAALIKKQAKEATQDTEYMVDEKGQGLLFNPDEFNYMGHESGSTLGKRR